MPRSQAVLSTGETPLTDPRSVGSSALFHAGLLLLAWLAVLNVAAPVAEQGVRPIHAELDPVDNRADGRQVPGEGGGSPGDIGGLSKLPLVAPDDRASGATASRDPAAEALLSE